jgi:hypothetical protein
LDEANSARIPPDRVTPSVFARTTDGERGAGFAQLFGMAHRIFTDASGVEWEVWDVRPSLSVDGVSAAGTLLSEEAAGGWLAFQCAQEKRRFYAPPDGWEEFTDAQLAKLCFHAVVATPSR